MLTGCYKPFDEIQTGGVILTRTASNSLFFCINCFSSSTILDMASFSVSKSLSAICHHEKETE